MIKLLVLGTRLFENLENSPYGFCLGSFFEYEVCTYGVIREQFEAVRGHKKEINLYAGPKWTVAIRNYQRQIQSVLQETQVTEKGENVAE